MSQSWLRVVKLVGVFCMALLVVICSLLSRGSSSLPPKRLVGLTATDDTTLSAISRLEVSMLENIKQNGFNDDPKMNGGMGGLYINWRYGTRPLQTNVNGTGEPDDENTDPRHDPLTEIRYVHNLWSYKHQNPKDTRYEDELARYTSIVKREFAQSHNERGWLFDELMAIYSLSHDSFYRETAFHLASTYANAFDPMVGSIYKRNSEYPAGSYRVDTVLEEGCALIQASVIFGKPEWMEKGQSIIKFIYAHAYLPRYHTFASQMANVFHDDGTVNPQQSFFSARVKNTTVKGEQIQMGAIAQIVISLLNAYRVTQRRDLLEKATTVLDVYSLPENRLGMWDDVNSGYFFSMNFTGSSPATATGFTINKKHKEAGRQILMLQAFHLADRITGGKYRVSEDQLLSLAIDKIYYVAGHGVLYDVNADWTLRKMRNGSSEDMVTTEAMGAELESLFSLDEV